MKSKQLLLFIACVLLRTTSAFSQNNGVNVNSSTGSANVNIPLYTLTKGQLVLPVNLIYSTNGNKAKDIQGTAGVGWQLQAGGEISRQVNGLPDDVNASRRGWMYSLTPPLFNFTIANTSNVCSNEATDLTYISTYLVPAYAYDDSEPDNFYVSAPGLSCQLVYDRTTAKFQPISYQDLVISYTTAGGTGNDAGLISSFTIINDKGTKYVFSAPQTDYQYITAGATPTVFTTKYSQYINGVYFYDKWSLTSITDVNSNSIQLTYDTTSVRYSTDPVTLYVNGATTPSTIYNVQNTIRAQKLTNISTYDANTADGVPALAFSWSSSTQTGSTVIERIFGTNRAFYFTYDAIASVVETRINNMLTDISDQAGTSGTATPLRYHFDYAGGAFVGDSTSKEVDYWGYRVPNGHTSLMPKVLINTSGGTLPRYSLYSSAITGGSYNISTTNGYDRSAGTTAFDLGCLSTVRNAFGGATSIVYEPNTYLDVPSNQVVRGGGIRVKTITDYDGINTANNIVHNYSYDDPTTSKTSGKPITLPIYAFTAPYNGGLSGQSYWDYATVLSDNDFSNEDHTIVYDYFRTSLTTADGGSTLLHTYNPGTYFDASAAPISSLSSPEWYPTVNKMGRSDCYNGYVTTYNDLYNYPFIPNPNYNFERGLPLKVTNYDQNGTEVGETTYTYNRSSTPSVITAFKADGNFSHMMGYNKYPIYFNTSELTTQVTKKVFDLGSTMASQTSSISYTYGSTYHKLQEQSVTNSDNSVLNTYYTYTKDFPASGSDPNVSAIYNLQQLNVNAPVESYQQVVRSGTTKTIGGSLTLFNSVTVGSNTMYVPTQQRKFVQSAGTTSFTPFNVTSGTPNYDAKYNSIPAVTLSAYDLTGYPQTIDDGNGNAKTTLINHFSRSPIAVFANAKYKEIAFSDFDSDLAAPDYAFTTSGAMATFTNGRMGYGLNFTTSQTISKASVEKHLGAQNYVLSMWINAATAGSITVSLNGTAAGSPKAYTGNSTWTYYEIPINVSSVTSPFTVSCTTSQPIVVDDILLYADASEVTTETYDPSTFYKTSQTNTNGVSTYFNNDAWGRVTYKYDQNHLMVQKNTYVLSEQVQEFNNLSVVCTSNLYSHRPLTFYNFSYAGHLDNMIGSTMVWNWGDGTSNTTTGWIFNTTHTYTTNGTYTVYLTVTSPIYGTKTVSTTIVLTTPPVIPIPLSYTNSTAGQDDIVSVSFTPVTTGTSYTFTTAQLSTASVAPNYYVVVINMAGARHYNGNNGYNSVRTTSDCFSSCNNWTSSGIYTFWADLSTCTYLNFTVSTDSCPTGPTGPPPVEL